MILRRTNIRQAILDCFNVFSNVGKPIHFESVRNLLCFGDTFDLLKSLIYESLLYEFILYESLLYESLFYKSQFTNYNLRISIYKSQFTNHNLLNLNLLYCLVLNTFSSTLSRILNPLKVIFLFLNKMTVLTLESRAVAI